MEHENTFFGLAMSSMIVLESSIVVAIPLLLLLIKSSRSSTDCVELVTNLEYWGVKWIYLCLYLHSSYHDCSVLGLGCTVCGASVDHCMCYMG